MNNRQYFLSVGKFITDKRKDMNLNQGQFGELVGISRSTISDIEKGGRLPSTLDLLSLCKELNITPNEILSVGGLYDLSSKKSKRKESEDDFIFIIKNFYSFFKLSKQSKILIGNLIYQIAKDENNDEFVKFLNDSELNIRSALSNPDIRKFMNEFCNLVRVSLDMEPLKEDVEIICLFSDIIHEFMNGGLGKKLILELKQK